MESDTLRATARAAQGAAPALVAASDNQIDDALEGMAALLEAAGDRILEANRADVETASGQLSAGLVDRMRLDGVRLGAVASQVRAMARLPAVQRCGSEP
jgi:glutamate-5-semialdehyde dehydrogenase